MNNVLGTYNLLKLADKYKIDQLVLISTDKAVASFSNGVYKKNLRTYGAAHAKE